MTAPVKPFRSRVGGRLHTLTVERAGGRWYAEARHRGALFAAGCGDTPGEALAFVRAMLNELAGQREAA